MNELPEGWLKAMGITITLATSDEVRAELTVGPEHLQGYGIVHGGVHCGLIESLASIGAALVALPRNQSVVGLENNTTFVRPGRAGAGPPPASPPLHAGPPHPGGGGAGPRRPGAASRDGSREAPVPRAGARARRREGEGSASPGEKL